MDIHNSITDIHNSIMEIHNSVMDIYNYMLAIMDIHKSIMYIHNYMLAIMDIHNSIMDIHNYRVYALLAFHTLVLLLLLMVVVFCGGVGSTYSKTRLLVPSFKWRCVASLENLAVEISRELMIVFSPRMWFSIHIIETTPSYWIEFPILVVASLSLKYVNYVLKVFSPGHQVNGLTVWHYLKHYA